MNDARSTEREADPPVVDARRVPPSETAGEVRAASQAGTAAEIPAALADHPRYRVRKLLGKGGMGAVFLAEHTVLKRAVALKVIRPELTVRPEAVERFRREVEATARLTHPNIVAAHDAEQAGDCFFLVTEYVEGIDLARRLHEHGPLPVAEACDCVRQAALGLQYAHERGLVHRDLKPHNLMRTASGQVKVLDFGLARVARLAQEGGTVSGVVLGTPDYMAPEQANDAHQADIRSDIYSLGCTLYQLLAGRVPFPGGGILDKLRRHAQEAPAPLSQFRPEVGPALARVLERMMARDPGERFQTPAEVADALGPWCAAPSETVSRQTFFGGGGVRRRRRAGVMAAAALGVCVLDLLVGLAAHFYFRSTPRPTEAAGPAGATVEAAPPPLIVSTDGTGDFTSLRQAVREAPTGSRLLLRAGRYEEAVVLRKPLEIAADAGGKVVISSPDDIPLTLSADGVRLRGLTVLTTANKPAVDVPAGAGVVLEDCDLRSAPFIALVVYNPKTEVLVRGCKFHDCKDTGGYVHAGAAATFEDCRFAGCANNGAAVYGGAKGVFRRCHMNDNTHGVYAQVGANARLEECTLQANACGLVICNGARGDLHRCKLLSNRACGMHLYNKSRVVLDDCDIADNTIEGIASYEAETIAVNCRLNRNKVVGLLALIRSKGRLEGCDLTGNGQSIRADKDSLIERNNTRE